MPTCRTCGKKFKGEHWKTQCKECYWDFRGFEWKCGEGRRHTPEDFWKFASGSPSGLGMWRNGMVVMEIKAIGGFEQHSHETWDEMWVVVIHASGYTLNAMEHIPPITAKGACLLCTIDRAIAKATKAETEAQERDT